MNFQINNSVNLSNIKPYNSGVNTIDYTYNKGTYTSNSNSQENPETEYLEIENIETNENVQTVLVEEAINQSLEQNRNNIANLFEGNEIASNAAMAAGGFANGVGNFGENIVDAGVTAGSVVATPFTWVYDQVTGSNVTEEMWNNSNAFVAEEHVNNAFEDFYTNNEIGQAMNENASEVMQYGNMGYNTAVGVGYLTATVASAGTASYMTGLGMASSGTAISGVVGFGRGTSDALNSGATTQEALFAGGLTGIWEGGQWWLGAEISGNGIATVAIDVVSGATDPLVRSGIQTTYNDQSFIENFEQNGGIVGMISNAAIAGGFSAFGETPTFRAASNSASSRISVNADTTINVKSTIANGHTLYTTSNVSSDINNMHILLDDSNITQNYSDFVTSYRNGYAGVLDELDNSRLTLYQTHQRLFVNSGFESALDYLDKYGLDYGQGEGYSRRIIEYYLDTGDSSVFTRQNEIREFMTSYSREDLTNLMNLREQYESLLSSPNLHNSSASLDNFNRYAVSTVDATIITGDAKQYLFQKLARRAQSNPQLRDELNQLRNDTVYWPNDGVSNNHPASALYDEQRLLDLGNQYLDGNEMNQYYQIKNNGSFLYEHDYQYTQQDKKVIFAQTRHSGTLVNNWLRGNVPIENVQQQLDLISKNYNMPSMTPEGVIQTYDNIIRNSVLKEPIVTYSGVDNLYIDGSELQISDLVPGLRIQDSAYRSASLVEGLEYDKPIKLEITAPAGTHAAYIESYSGLDDYHLQEVIYSRNSILEITGFPCYNNLTGKLTIPCTIVEE